ncbi:MAG: nitrogen fixation protein NifH [Bacillota bacterium]|nr:nitrogen fixation protein NifH [Bacillota bacterium]
MSWKDQLKGDTLSWLLDENEPGVRYLAMRDLLELPSGDSDLISACEKAHSVGPISIILEQMNNDGYWVTPGPGYNPKYRSSVWSLILLAQLGALISFDQRIEKACRYLIENALTEHGQFSASGTPSSTVDCLQGNMCASMIDLGYNDPRLENAFEWMARSVTGEGVAPMEDKKAALRYYSGKYGPGFLCGANNKEACAWGAVKVMLAFGKLPLSQRTPLIERAIEKGIEFLFSVDPVDSTYPSGWNEKPSGNWWKFGFPVFYVTDLLQNVEALVNLGFGRDQRLANALKYIRDKQDNEGRWAIDYDYPGKTWVDFGPKKQPNKWVTLRAARVIKDSFSNKTKKIF